MALGKGFTGAYSRRVDQYIGTEEMGKIIIRLRRIEGQVRGLQRMLDEGRPCEEVFAQLSATKAALDRACTLLVALKMRECLAPALDEMSHAATEKAQATGKVQEIARAQAIEKALETFLKHSRWLDVVMQDAGDGAALQA